MIVFSFIVAHHLPEIKFLVQIGHKFPALPFDLGKGNAGNQGGSTTRSGGKNEWLMDRSRDVDFFLLKKAIRMADSFTEGLSGLFTKEALFVEWPADFVIL